MSVHATAPGVFGCNPRSNLPGLVVAWTLPRTYLVGVLDSSLHPATPSPARQPKSIAWCCMRLSGLQLIWLLSINELGGPRSYSLGNTFEPNNYRSLAAWPGKTKSFHRQHAGSILSQANDLGLQPNVPICLNPRTLHRRLQSTCMEGRQSPRQWLPWQEEGAKSPRWHFAVSAVWQLLRRRHRLRYFFMVYCILPPSFWSLGPFSQSMSLYARRVAFAPGARRPFRFTSH
jgi:hypothetical protein